MYAYNSLQPLIDAITGAHGLPDPDQQDLAEGHTLITY